MNSLLLLSALKVLTWGDLEIGNTYTLNQSVHLTPRVTLKAGTQIKLQDVVSLSPVQVFSVEFKLAQCTGSIVGEKSEIVIVQPYGVELEPGCRVNMYVEIGDYYKPSLVGAGRVLSAPTANER